MSEPICSYIVKARAAYLNEQSGDIEYIATEKKFFDKNPIEAREEAFNYRNLIISGMIDTGTEYDLDDLGWDKYSYSFKNATERELRKILNQFFPNDEDEDSETFLISEDGTKKEIEWIPPDDTLTWYPLFKNGIWILFDHNDEELIDEDNDIDLVIDKITGYEEPLPSPPFYENLELEYKFYKKHGYDIKDYEIKVDFWDDEAYLDGDENYYCKLTILKTSFDWTGYEKEGWWEDEKKENAQDEESSRKVTLPYTIYEAFKLGENHFVEYKPGLINRVHSERDIEFEIVKTIAAFLNKEGGYLFIGVADKKKRIIGLELPENSQDKFLLEFTRIKLRYLPPHIAHTVNGKFYSVKNKSIFGITILPSNSPVFVKIRDENNRVISKEFYVRSDAASRHLYDIEEVVNYCRRHW